MTYFTYKNGILHAEAVSVPNIIVKSGTPVYIYSAAALREAFCAYEHAFSDMNPLICYGVKANSNIAILRLLAKLGAGMDIVSQGEYARAIAAGVNPEKIVFSGVGKTDTEIHTALTGGLHQFNIESEAELVQIDKIAGALGKKAPVAFRINPDIDAGTLEQISTGRKQDKFGIPYECATAIYTRARQFQNINIVGVDMHIGSQITDLTPFRRAYRKMAELVRKLREEHHIITRLNIGGGLGISYGDSASENPPTPLDLSNIVRDELGALGCAIAIEPGRSIAGNAGIMVSKVIYEKTTDSHDFLIIDGAMNDLIRPALYDAYHNITPIKERPAHSKTKHYDIVGPICESSDRFVRHHLMAELQQKDLIAFHSAGAYAAAMASEYNTRPLISEVLVDKNRFAIIRKRAKIENIIKRDIIPNWLT